MLLVTTNIPLFMLLGDGMSQQGMTIRSGVCRLGRSLSVLPTSAASVRNDAIGWYDGVQHATMQAARPLLRLQWCMLWPQTWPWPSTGSPSAKRCRKKEMDFIRHPLCDFISAPDHWPTCLSDLAPPQAHFPVGSLFKWVEGLRALPGRRRSFAAV